MRRVHSKRAKRTPRRPHVALIVETSVVYGRQILRGIARYLRTHRSWSVFLEERELRAPPPRWVREWRGDGIICRSTTPELAQLFRRHRLAAVDLNDLYGDLGLPHIGSDMKAIGRMGAEHLLDRGFRHLAFGGFSGEAWSSARRDGFVEAARGRGEVHGTYESPWAGLRSHPWEQERDRIAQWLKPLPRPFGVMTCNDVRGQHVLDACKHLGAAVPDEIAVVGVDNAETFCELTEPPLSSVVPNAERIGYEAAALLDRLMNGAKAPRRAIAIQPLRVVTRQSTDVLAIEDPETARAVRFVREHACDGISVDDVLAQVACSRSILERQFRRYLTRSPQAEIREVQLKRVRQLLAETDWPLQRVAEKTGFEHPEYLSVLFKRETGQTPGQYRRTARPRAHAADA